MTRHLVTYPVAHSDGPSNNSSVTSSRATRFISLWIIPPSGGRNAIGVGGVQTQSVEQTNGGRFEPQASNDYLEIIFGAQQWTANFTRRVIRGYDMQEIALQMYPDMDDVDWREIPFILATRYIYQSYNGGKTFEDSRWRVRKCFVNSYRIDHIPNATDVQRETLTMIASGHQRQFANGSKVGTPNSIVGADYFSGVNNSVVTSTAKTTAKPNPATPNNPPAPGSGSTLNPSTPGSPPGNP